MAAAQLLTTEDAARVAADCRPVVASGKFVLIRSGATTASILDAETFSTFVRGFATALTQRGLEAIYLEEDDPMSLTEEVRRTTQTVFVAEDYELVSQVELARKLVRQSRAESTPTMPMATRKTIDADAAGPVKGHIAAQMAPRWVVVDGSPLSRWTTRMTRPTGENIVVYVSADAALPADVARPAAGWVEAVVNGGTRGAHRTLEEMRSSRRLGVVAVELRARNVGVADELVSAFASVAEVYAGALLDRAAALHDTSDAWPDILDHLLRRLRQARTEAVLLDPIDVLDQIAGNVQQLEEIVL
jgi:hypothetical protein